MNQRKPRMYEGNLPDEKDGWWMFDFMGDENGAGWEIFARKQDHSDEWVTFKVCAIEKVARKANYWLARNIETGQIGYSRDLGHMKQHRPVLYRRVMESLERHAA